MSRGSGDAAGRRHEFVSREAWVEALLDRDVRIRFETYGYARLPAGWGFTDRRVPEHLVYAVANESMTAEIADQSSRLTPTSFCLLPPHTPHTFGHADPSRPVTLHYFRLELRRRGVALRLDHAPVVLQAAPSLREHLERLHDDQQSASRYASLRVRASLALLFSSALQLADAGSTNIGTLSHRQRAQLYQLVREERRARLQPAELAGYVGLSADHFTRLFRHTFGVAPRRWLVEHRVSEAATLLTDSALTVSEVARELGYPDVYQFSRQFKQVTGASPSEYRRRSDATRALPSGAHAAPIPP